MSSEIPPTVDAAKRSLISKLSEWGRHPLPPMLLATLTFALHAKPIQPLPLIFPPVLLFSTYLNLSGFKIDSAGLTAAWSGLYLLLASRRRFAASGIRNKLKGRFGARGLVRGSAMALSAANVVGGGTAYAFGNRKEEKEMRGE